MADTITRRSTDYSDSIRDRKLLERANAALRWLASPVARLVLPRKQREEMTVLVAELAERLTPVEREIERPKVAHLTHTPAHGSFVILLRDSWYMREHHGASKGAVGMVVEPSRLNPDDTGVLVDWGNGRRSRVGLHEVAAWAGSPERIRGRD